MKKRILLSEERTERRKEIMDMKRYQDLGELFSGQTLENYDYEKVYVTTYRISSCFWVE